MPLEAGTVINKVYRVVKHLGKGVMGNLYLVEREKDGKKFVLRELEFPSEPGSTEAASRDIFFRQSDFMKRCNHPGLPETSEGIFSENEQDYLIIEYIEGKTLKEIIDTSPGPLPEDKAVKWTIDLAEILTYFHSSFHRTIIYRNLKPSNIIITPEDKVKLVDFGVLRYYEPGKDTDTVSYGVPGYAAPEQYKGKGQSTPQSDIYGLGVILFEMLTKYDPEVKPFTFPSMKSLNPSVSPEVEKIITKAIDLDPEKRYGKMIDFKKSLEEYLGIYEEPLPEKPPAPPPRFSGSSVVSTVILLLLIVFAIGATLVPNFLRARGSGQLAACESNLKNIGTALEMYAADYGGNYPPSLVYLTDYNYFKVLPHCPTKSNSPYLYEVNSDFDYYTLTCGGKPKCHIETGTVAKTGSWPQYVPYNGVILRPINSELGICATRLRKIAICLELYGKDNQGHYPLSLDHLTGYIKSLPLCPIGGTYGYKVSSGYDNFTLFCGTPGVHSLQSGYWPQYTPGEKIMKRSIDNRLDACLIDLKSIGAEVDMYAIDNEGKYPPFLKRNYFKKSYPYWNYNYEVTSDFDNYTIWCDKHPGHPLLSKYGSWPQYTPGKGLSCGK